MSAPRPESRPPQPVIDPSLPSDIERVLQNAIADINASVNSATAAGKPSKKRRRAAETAGDHAERGDGEMRKKKKRKARMAADEGVGDEPTAEKDKGKGREVVSQVPLPPGPPPPLRPPSPPYEDYLDPALAQFARPPWHFGGPPPPMPPHPDAFMPNLFPVPPLPIPPGTNSSDLIRALQQIDLSKFANSLRAMSADAGNAAASGSAPRPAATEKTATPNRVGSGAGGMIKEKEKVFEGMDHATLLATKWMNPNKLAELVASEGLQYKKGKFSAIEEDLITKALEEYRISRNMSEDALKDVIFAKGKKAREANSTFWSEITSSVPHRPIIAVYHHVRRTYHPMKRMGKWTHEEDRILREAVTEFGQAWERVSEKVGRMSSDCRDRYRNHIQYRNLRVSGAWSAEEEEQLTRIVREMTLDQGKNAENDIFWGIVSDRMGNTRTRQQCRIKWTDALNKRVKNAGNRPRWSAQDAYILVQKIASLNIQHDSEIDWKLIADSDWNLWSAHQLQRRWFRMKKSVKGGEDMPFPELVEILKDKKSLPSDHVLHRQQSRNKSKAIVSDEDEFDDASEVEETLGQGAHDSDDMHGPESSLNASTKGPEGNSQKGKAVARTEKGAEEEEDEDEEEEEDN